MFIKLVFIICFFLFLSISNGQFQQPHSEAFGDQLRIGVVGSVPRYFNPYQVKKIELLQINRLVFGPGLIQQVNRFGESEEQLVEKYFAPETDAAQNLEWKFTLKRNIYFHNDLALRNADVLFTFNILKKWGGEILNRNIDFQNVKSIEIGGDLVFQFNLFKRDPDFIRKLSDVPIISKLNYQNLEYEGFDYFQNVNPLGYGPFKYQKINDQTIYLNPHSIYVFGRPFLDGISFTFFQDEQQMIDAFIQGDIDFLEVKDRITAERLHQILQKDLNIFSTPRPEKKVYFLQFNVNKFPFQDSKDRTALRRALNINEIIVKLLLEKGHLAYSLLHQNNEYFYDDLEKDRFDPRVSVNLLRTNGWEINETRGTLEKNRTEFEFELLFERNSYLEESIARAIKINLADIGINVQPIPVDNQTREELLSNNDFMAAINSFSYDEDELYNAFKIFYYDVLKKNIPYTNFDNLTLERLFRAFGESIEINKQQIYRLQIILYQEVPVIFLFFDEKILYAVSSRYQDIRLSYPGNNSYYYRLNPFENWFVPKSLQKFFTQ